MSMASKFLNITLCIVLAISCGPSVQKEPASTSKQAAVACIVTGPAAPVCAVTVTGAQWIITILVAGAVVGTATVAASSSAKTVQVGQYRATLRPTPVPAPHPTRPQPISTPCAPCGAPPASRFDQVPPSRPHWPCGGSHTHHFKMNQNPQTCQCFPQESHVTCH